MTNQNISTPDMTLGSPVRMPDDDRSPPPYPSDTFARRAAKYAPMVRGAPPILIPAELVTSHIVTLPKSGARQKAALLTYAVEDRVAAQIDSVQVVQGPLRSETTGEALALSLIHI